MSGDDKPWRNGDLLVELYIHRDLSKEDLAARWGCSEMTVYRWVKKALSDTPYGYDCEECGETFPTDRGMRQHYGQAHNGTVAGHPIECTHCGEVERKPACEVKGVENPFCRQKCYIDWMKEDGRVETECAHCENPLSRPRWQVEASDKQFCNDTCQGDWVHESGPRGENHHSYKPRDKVMCQHCGTENERRVSYPDVANSFCDADCYGAWVSETGAMRGENSPSYKGGSESHYGGDWLVQRERRLEMDGRSCSLCGMDEVTHRETDPQEQGLRVHHITPYRRFDDPFEANLLGNLVTLCRGCHKTAERMAPLLPTGIERTPAD